MLTPPLPHYSNCYLMYPDGDLEAAEGDCIGPVGSCVRRIVLNGFFCVVSFAGPVGALGSAAHFQEIHQRKLHAKDA